MRPGIGKRTAVEVKTALPIPASGVSVEAYRYLTNTAETAACCYFLDFFKIRRKTRLLEDHESASVPLSGLDKIVKHRDGRRKRLLTQHIEPVFKQLLCNGIVQMTRCAVYNEIDVIPSQDILIRTEDIASVFLMGSLTSDIIRLNYRNNLLMLRKNLGKTIALKMMQDGEKASEAAAKGARKAVRTIHARMFMDGMSAAVYLLTFRWAYLRSVFTAHRDFRKLRGKVTVSDIRQYLKEHGSDGRVTGMSSRWIIPAAVFCRRRIFRKMNPDR